MATAEFTPIPVHILARVGDGDAREIATLHPELTLKPMPGRHGQPTETMEAVAEVTFDLAGALRAAAAAAETSEERADTIERMRVAYTEAWEEEDARQAQARRDGTWAKTSTPHARSRAGITAALEALEGGSDIQLITRSDRDRIDAGIAAAIATLQDRETGAGSDLEEDVHVDDEENPVWVEVRGNVDIQQLVVAITEAVR